MRMGLRSKKTCSSSSSPTVWAATPRVRWRRVLRSSPSWASSAGRTKSADCSWPYGIEPDLSACGNRLRTAIHLANRRVFRAAEKYDEYTGMGTTVVSALISGNRAHGRARRRQPVVPVVERNHHAADRRRYLGDGARRRPRFRREGRVQPSDAARVDQRDRRARPSRGPPASSMSCTTATRCCCARMDCTTRSTTTGCASSWAGTDRSPIW